MTGHGFEPPWVRYPDGISFRIDDRIVFQEQNPQLIQDLFPVPVLKFQLPALETKSEYPLKGFGGHAEEMFP